MSLSCADPATAAARRTGPQWSGATGRTSKPPAQPPLGVGGEAAAEALGAGCDAGAEGAVDAPGVPAAFCALWKFSIAVSRAATARPQRAKSPDCCAALTSAIAWST
jgi:hypothetical protein